MSFRFLLRTRSEPRATHTCLTSAFRLISTNSAMPSLEHLQDQWNELYKKRLPALAKQKDASQKKWPIQLDHCFARIILDNAIGKDKPWNQAIKSPAYKNMTQEQLKDAIALGEKVANGEEDLVALDETSLALRGKRSKEREKKANKSASKKRKINSDDRSNLDCNSKSQEKRRKTKIAKKRPNIE